MQGISSPQAKAIWQEIMRVEREAANFSHGNRVTTASQPGPHRHGNLRPGFHDQRWVHPRRVNLPRSLETFAPDGLQRSFSLLVPWCPLVTAPAKAWQRTPETPPPPGRAVEPGAAVLARHREARAPLGVLTARVLRRSYACANARLVHQER